MVNFSITTIYKQLILLIFRPFSLSFGTPWRNGKKQLSYSSSPAEKLTEYCKFLPRIFFLQANVLVTIGPNKRASEIYFASTECHIFFKLPACISTWIAISLQDFYFLLLKNTTFFMTISFSRCDPSIITALNALSCAPSIFARLPKQQVLLKEL